jgi:hypothetical protein
MAFRVTGMRGGQLRASVALQRACLPYQLGPVLPSRTSIRLQPVPDNGQMSDEREKNELAISGTPAMRGR